MYGPGDFFVTPIPDGFMVGRILRPAGPARWWEPIRIDSSFELAVALARQAARAMRTRVWFYENAAACHPIEDDEDAAPAR
jgi:hypothetical protein